MRRGITLAIGTFVLMLVGASAGWAQTVPSGSYQQTCKDIGVRNDVLTARCQDTGGSWRDTQLRDVSSCSGDVFNDNGALRCNGGGGAYNAGYNGGYYQGGIPGGSYSQTCRDVRVRGNDLEAKCQTVNGDWRDTRLNGFGRCSGDISNEDGQLRCAGSGYNGPGGYNQGYPGGSYTQTCRDIRKHGDTLEAKCQSRDGDWHKTTLNDYDDCRGQIVNEDGNLRCENSGYGPPGRGRGGYRGGIPNGSYSQTCQDIHVSGNKLEARCQKRNGSFRNTSLDNYRACSIDINNIDGHLRCGQ